MAVDLTLKSNAITNREATPSVANSPGRGGASRMKAVSSKFSVTTAPDLGSVIRMVEVPSNAVVHRITFQSADLGTAGLLDVGVYRTNKDGGAVVDADFFAVAIDVNAAVTARTDITNQSTTNTIAKQNQPLWQAIGMTSDPKSMLDIAITSSEAWTATTGDIGLMVSYSD